MKAYCPKERGGEGGNKEEREDNFDILSIFLLARIYFNIFLKDASALIYRLGDMRASSKRFSSSGIFFASTDIFSRLDYA